MPTKKMPASPTIYQIKVTLLGTKPLIWRRLLVPAEMTLEELHYVLQVAMGWENYHLHEFRIGRKRFGEPDPYEGLVGLPAVGNQCNVRLFDVLGKVGAKALYTYDFGDGWEHAVVVEKVLAPEPGLAYPVCVGGKYHAPPEDCGGIPGFYDLLEALADPKHDRHEELLEWIGGEFDPNAFSADEVNRRFSPLQRRRASRKK